jgi:HlyD family secretion protein
MIAEIVVNASPDLSHFKIRGSVDDDFSDHLKTGASVYVAIDNANLTGRVGTISPVIRDRKIDFDVSLQESNHFRLRPNLSVELEVVITERDSVVRIANGPLIGRGREHEIYVLKPGGAEVRNIRTGLKTEDYVEVVEGLEEGERVILSEVGSLEDLEEMELR